MYGFMRLIGILQVYAAVVDKNRKWKFPNGNGEFPHGNWDFIDDRRGLSDDNQPFANEK